MASIGHWRLLTHIITGDLIPVSKYVSDKTGLRVVVADVDGPLVNGYFALATEALDDDGLPHTLEHLIFLGSRSMPYKGILDLIANRCLSSGTNAWTSTDHTCYTMSTLGSEGFLSMFPTYVEHILWPTLTKEGYVTEVHHINGEGEDAGVVYCEMQGRENSAESRSYLALLRSAYPGRTGIKSETGGIMKNIRESTSHQKVKDYHKAFYRPENLVLVITGKILAEKVFEALAPIEDQIMADRAKDPPEPYVRPWQDPVPPLPGYVEEDVSFPCDVDDSGMVLVAWRSPKLSVDIRIESTTEVLMEYLTESSISPLQATFVESDDPLASGLTFYTEIFSESLICLVFRNVPKRKIHKVEGVLNDTLKDLASGTIAFDMPRMRNVIERRILQRLENLESTPHETAAWDAIGNEVYGTVENLKDRLNIHKFFEEQLEKSEEDWIKLLQEIVDSTKVVIRGMPSTAMKYGLATAENARIYVQRKALGTEGLLQKKNILEQAIEENEKPAPDSLIEDFKIPDIKSINFHPISVWNSGSDESSTHFGIDLSSTKVHTNALHVKSNFVNVLVLMDSGGMSSSQRAYLPLLETLLLESPIEKNGRTIPYQQVVKELNEDTIAHSAACGASNGNRYNAGTFSEVFSLSLQVHQGRYHKAFEWVHDLLFSTVFTVERTKVIATKMFNGIPELKRDGRHVAKTVANLLIFGRESNGYWHNICTQQAFLEKIMKKLNAGNNEAAEVIQDLTAVRNHLTQKMALFVSTSFDRVKAPLDGFGHVLPPTVSTKIPSPTYRPDSALGLKKSSRRIIVGLGSVESSFLVHRITDCIPCYDHPDYIPLRLFLQYLTLLEGPMWRKIRGAGLAYGYFANLNVQYSSLELSIVKSTHIFKAFQVAKDTLNEALLDGFEWNDLELEAAKSSLIFEFVETVTTVSEAVSKSISLSLWNLPQSEMRTHLDQIMAVTTNDLQRVGKNYIRRMFEQEASTVIVCHTDKVEEVKSDFAKIDMDFETYGSLDDAFKGLDN